MPFFPFLTNFEAGMKESVAKILKTRIKTRSPSEIQARCGLVWGDFFLEEENVTTSLIPIVGPSCALLLICSVESFRSP